VSDGDASKSRSGGDIRGMNRDSIVSLRGYDRHESDASKPPFACNGGMESDAEQRVDCQPGTDHRSK